MRKIVHDGVVKLPPLHPGQRRVLRSKARFKILACGRRWGKSFLCALLCILNANQGKFCWWVAPTYDQGKIGWDMLLGIVSQIPGVLVSKSELKVTFPSKGIIQIRSAEKPDNLRGVGIDFLVMDECREIERRAWVEVLRPALADKKGEAVFISTPKGRDWFHEMYQRGLVEDQNVYESWSAPTSDNPYIDREEIEEARRTMDNRTFRQEFKAEFLEDSGGVFRGVRNAATAKLQDAPESGHEYVFGVDLARKHDYTVFAVLDCTLKSVTKVDRFSGVEYAQQMLRLKALTHLFQPRMVVVESNSAGAPVIEVLQKEIGVIYPFSTQIKSKMKIIDGLVLAFEEKAIQIPNDEAIIGEFQAYESKVTRTGMISYSAPEGYNDDVVMAVAMAWEFGKHLGNSQQLVQRRAVIL